MATLELDLSSEVEARISIDNAISETYFQKLALVGDVDGINDQIGAGEKISVKFDQLGKIFETKLFINIPAMVIIITEGNSQISKVK